MDGMNLRLHDQIDKETCHIISYIAFDWMNMRVDGVRNKRMTMSLGGGDLLRSVRFIRV